MKKQTLENYYTSRRGKLLKDFDKIAKSVRDILISHYGEELTDTTIRETRQEYDALIPQLPYIGKRNIFLDNLIFSAMFLALYRVLKKYGRTVEESGKIIYEIAEVYHDEVSRFYVRRLRRQAAESQKRHCPEDWVFTLIEGDGKGFDLGIDFTECGIYKFFHAQGADEFTPFLCLLDFPVSKAFGMELVRTATIAQGADKCDFRYKRVQNKRRMASGVS